MHSTQVGCTLLGTALAVNACRDDTSGITGSLATGEQTMKAHMLKSSRIADDTDRARRTGLHSYEHSLVREEAMVTLSKIQETFLQTFRDERGHPEMKRRTDQAGRIAAFRQIKTEPAIYEVIHALGWSRLTAVAL